MHAQAPGESANRSMDDSSVPLARFLAETRFDALPANVIEHAKASILDTLACVLLGSANAELRPINHVPIENDNRHAVAKLVGIAA